MTETNKKIIGYGLVGPGEAGRYMRETLECFKRLCDEVILLVNNADQAEIDLINEYGFKYRLDRRTWGEHQWRIKQDFIERDIKQLANEGDVLVCLDMDEVLSERCTKEWLLEAPLDAYHVFVVDLWNDPQHFKPESCFWNVRIWKWNGETKYKAKPVHCGLAPEWTYHYHRHAPFLLLHKGLMAEEDRLRKIKRYEKYDPHAEHLDKQYYDMLKSNTARPFDEEAMADQIAEEVATYNQSKPRKDMVKKPKPRFAYVKNPHGITIDIPEKHLNQTLKRKGFEFIGWAEEDREEIEAMFEDEDTGNVPAFTPHPAQKNNYNRTVASEKAEIDSLNAKDDVTLEETKKTHEEREEIKELFDDKEPKMSGFSAPVTEPSEDEAETIEKGRIQEAKAETPKKVANKKLKK